jgi:hypothetical protein
MLSYEALNWAISYLWTCLFYSVLCYLDVSLPQQTLLPECVCSTADFVTWTCLFYSKLCYLYVSVLQQTMLSWSCLFYSTAYCAIWTCQFYSRLCYPGRVCSTAYCATWTCLFNSRLCYLDVSLQQQTLLPVRVCSTACILCYLDVSVLHQTLLPGRVCSTAACPALRLERVCSCICCLGRCLAYSSLCCT